MSKTEAAMTGIDEIFRILAGRPAAFDPLICCLYHQNNLPRFAEPMPRDPSPEVGQFLDQNFAETVRAAIAFNEAIHDGAIMAAVDHHSRCTITGWSYRLFPPPSEIPPPVNKGSAFNSCVAMSLVPGILALYLVSKGTTWRFERGSVNRL
ncbi:MULTISPECIES: hypothetical protein [Bradyrhizobium]|uniref:Uncharacterized protein n=4 Tax=Bradyrhizobium TaxID=374 RepID=A0AAE6CCS0_9BRAD|nr:MULTISPECIES: hypothetical protein [Bradyrhizobium]WIW50481.1 hypothetical protein ML401_35795 [Bradyrhizobium sp. 62B]MCG2629457.1 hypothetical protein [Bradyrhizobium zhengyangense]MCG2644915.1 hypothetical protein [Bradyrhizobium zhengyangense]MCG2670971.1 hypothetical protein [Bradyrhizobium zhengyangense]MDN4984606.1 hypothetical protein [Bradyrhizobium sp. WYCCWR 13022]